MGILSNLFSNTYHNRVKLYFPWMNLSIMQLQHLGSTEIIVITKLNENEMRFIEPIHKILQNIFLYKTLFNLFL